MIRTTITLDEKLISNIEGLYGKKAYLNFSAICRNLIKKGLLVEGSGEIV